MLNCTSQGQNSTLVQDDSAVTALHSWFSPQTLNFVTFNIMPNHLCHIHLQSILFHTLLEEAKEDLAREDFRSVGKQFSRKDPVLVLPKG